MTIAIHRLVEQQAAARGDALAYVDDACALTYRELNAKSNAVARALVGAGFRRGAIAIVRAERSAELAVTLLGVLKAGGAYSWRDAIDASSPAACVVTCSRDGEEQWLDVDVRRLLAEPVPPSPNLPILTRGSDVACVMDDGMLVPHATVTALAQRQVARDAGWCEEGGALDLWMALMTGATVTVTAAPATLAA